MINKWHITNTECYHIPYKKKQLREPTAMMFLVGWKSKAVVFFMQSTRPRGEPFPTICLATVLFLQFSSYWVLEPSTSIMWKQLLQLPVPMVLPSGEATMENLSKMASFSNISLNLPFRPSLMLMVEIGFLELQTSQILTVRKSRETMYFPCLVNSPAEQLPSSSARKFFWPEYQFLKLVAVASQLDETRRSHNLRVPLLVPQRKRLSDVGWILLKFMLSLTSQILLSFSRSANWQGFDGFSKFHIKQWTSSEDKAYSSL